MDLATPEPVVHLQRQVTRHELPDRIEYRTGSRVQTATLRKLYGTKEKVPVWFPDDPKGTPPEMLRLQRRTLAYPIGTAYEFFFLMNLRGAPVAVNVEHVRIHFTGDL